MDAKEIYKHSWTVGQILRFIEKHNIPDDALILLQRVEDKYFEKSEWNGVKMNGWTTIKKEGEQYHYLTRWNNDVDSGKYLDKEEYPLMTEEYLKKATEEELENSKDQYYPCFSPVKYPNDDNIYLDAHY